MADSDKDVEIRAVVTLDDSQFKQGMASASKVASKEAKSVDNLNKKSTQLTKKFFDHEKKHLKEKQKHLREEEKHIRNVSSSSQKQARLTKQQQLNELNQVRQLAQLVKRMQSGGGGGGGASATGADSSGGGGGRRPGGRGSPAGRPSLARRIGGTLLGGVARAAAFGIGAAKSFLMPGLDEYKQFGQVKASLMGMGGSLGDISGSLGQRLGYSLTDMYAGAKSAGRATGHIRAVNDAAVASRFYGGSIDEVTSLMGTITRTGGGTFESQNSSGAKLLGKLLTEAVKSGLDKSRAAEHFEAVAQLATGVGMRQVGGVDVGGISAFASLIGQHGGEGLRGARGLNVLSQIDAGIRAGGKDSFSQGFLHHAIGFGLPGSNIDYLTARRIQQRGLFGGGKINTELLDNIFALAESESPDRKTAVFQLAESGLMGNLTDDQIEEFWDAYEKAKGDEESMTALLEKMQRDAKPIEEKMLDSTNQGVEYLDVVRQQAAITNQNIENGQQLWKASVEIQNVIRDILQKTLPFVKFLLEEIARLLRKITGTSEGESSARIEKLLDSPIYKMSGEQATNLRPELETEIEKQRELIANLEHEYNKKKKEYEEELSQPGSFFPMLPGSSTSALDRLERKEGKELKERKSTLEQLERQLGVSDLVEMRDSINRGRAVGTIGDKTAEAMLDRVERLIHEVRTGQHAGARFERQGETIVVRLPNGSPPSIERFDAPAMKEGPAMPQGAN